MKKHAYYLCIIVTLFCLQFETNAQIYKALDSLGNKISYTYNVKSYGAVGDSVTNDSAAVYNTIYAADGGGTVVIPKGQYRVGEIILEGLSDITIEGSGKESIIENGGNYLSAFKLKNSHNITFQNFTIRGDFLTMLNNHDSQAGIICVQPGTTDSVSNIVIQNMYFNNLGSDALAFNSNATNIKIINNTWEDGLGFVQLIGTVATPVDNVLIQGNTILGSVVSERGDPGSISGSDDIIDMWGTIRNVNIVDNYFDARRLSTDTTCVNHGVLILGVDNPLMGSFTNINIENNTFVNFHNSRQTPFGNTYYTVGAIEVNHANFGADSSARGITIRNNKLYAEKSRMIFLSCPMSSVLVEGNDIYGGATGIFIFENLGYKSVMKTIKNNNIQEFTESGIYLQANNTLIKNNIINMDSVDIAGGYGIFATTCDSNYIIGNLIEGGSALHRGLFVAQSSFLFIENNIFRNIPGTAVEFGTYISTDNISFKNNIFSNNGTNLVNSNVQDIFALSEGVTDVYYADRYYTGNDGYLSGDDNEVYSTNKEGKTTKITHNLSTNLPYDVVDNTSFARNQADGIFNYFSNENKERQIGILSPAIDDTLSCWLRTTGKIIIDSIKAVADDSVRIQAYFGNDSLFSNPELINLDTTIITFDVNTIPAGSRVRLFFTYMGDSVFDFSAVLYYHDLGSETFSKKYLLDTYLRRVTENGGVIVDTQAVESFYNMMVENGIIDSIKHASGTSYGVKFDADSNIIKLFDLSIYKNDVAQIDTNYSPDLRLSQINGYGTVSFDGTNDFMDVQIENLSQPETMFLVCKADTWQGSRFFIDGYNTQSGGISMLGSSPLIGIFSGLISDGGQSINIGSFDLLTATYDGANSSIQVNDLAAESCSLGVENMDGLTLGRVGGTSALFGDVDLSEQIIVDNNTSATLRTAIKNFLNNKYIIY
jgi:hypothetical protein